MAEKICPRYTNGSSTGRAPSHVRISHTLICHQKKTLFPGYSLIPRNLLLYSRGQIYRIKIDKAKAATPPNLLGIDRKIAYAIKKYHSG